MDVTKRLDRLALVIQAARGHWNTGNVEQYGAAMDDVVWEAAGLATETPKP